MIGVGWGGGVVHGWSRPTNIIPRAICNFSRFMFDKEILTMGLGLFWVWFRVLFLFCFVLVFFFVFGWVRDYPTRE